MAGAVSNDGKADYRHDGEENHDNQDLDGAEEKPAERDDGAKQAWPRARISAAMPPIALRSNAIF